MKKSLLALAVFGAFAGAASAQSNVTIYGVVDAGITYESRGAVPAGQTGDSAWKLATGVQSGNRIGFKGTEDLGSGLKANFQLENGFNGDTGTIRQGGALFGRQAWVGLSGGFGSVSLGRQYDPLFIGLDSIDPFGTGLTGASTNLMAGGTAGASAAAQSGDVRINNSIVYSTNNLGGFTGNLAYGLGEVPGANSAGRTYALSGNYANGPINAVLAYSNNNNGTAAAPAVTNTTKVWLLGGTYDFGVAKAHLAYETEKNDVGLNYRDWLLGVSAPLGQGTVMASYINKNDRSAAGNAGAKQYALGYTYALSKRTNLYTSYSRVNNDGAAAFFAGDASSGGLAPAAGSNSNAFTVGVRHKF
ncbi:porin [Noviherbaspirillum galbum]|uniref:Porin n=1 Tax=Noviherbaspirillum galbum TaxID=2709383 RepID=A0A6B3SXF6_9BURK|nr:porin [Noviherbaspirillum galbum]NEX64235.1 porin [Noviherbaspirillum galbum]